jgi:hypothetical protein
MEPIRIPSDSCICGHLEEDHEPECFVIEDGVDCRCTCFKPDEDEWGYWFFTEYAEDGESRLK